jgi:hypothetical protein
LREVTPLQFNQTSTKTTYGEGDGVFQLLTGATPPPGYSILEAYAIEIDPSPTSGSDPEYHDGIARPVSFCCKDACQKCNKIICSPDLAQAEPPTTGSTTTALPFAVEAGDTWLLDEPNQTLSLKSASPRGPVFVVPAPPPPATLSPTQVNAIREQLGSWLAPRTTHIIMHMFLIRDPANVHPLRNKVIAIPARFPDPPPP